jgi:putative ABC transport system substrate-binding protein
MRRRDFITLLGGAAMAWPLAARAQQPERMRRIGVLMNFAESAPGAQARLAAVREELQRLGWRDGGNVRFDYRWSAGDVRRLPAAAAELVAMQPDVIASGGGQDAVKNATTTIPVVQVGVAGGMVASLARPSGNFTGLTIGTGLENAEKWLEILHEAVPSASRIAAFYAVGGIAGVDLASLAMVADRALHVTLLPYGVQGAGDFPAVFDAVARDQIDALIVFAHTLTVSHSREIVAFSAAHRLPAVYGTRDFMRDGGLMTYDASIEDVWRRAAAYVDRILKGTKPADLPIERPSKFQLIINLKTAKALGLTIPPSLLARADEVIE